IALTGTVRANIAPGDIEAHYTATDSGPKGHVNLIFKIVAGLRTFLRRRAASAKHAGENIAEDRKSTRLNSSHLGISYAVFCLKNHSTTEFYTLSLHDALPIYIALTGTVRANIAPGDIEAHYTATDSGPKGHVNLIFKIVAGLRTFLRRRAASAKHAGENIA